MGIKDLGKVIRMHAKDGCFVHKLSSWKGLKVAVDVSTMFYADFSVVWTRYLKTIDIVTTEPTRSQVTTDFIDLFLMSICKFLEAGITPILVFDGTAPIEKDTCHIERRDRKEKTEKEIASIRSGIVASSSLLDCNKSVGDRLVTLYSRICKPGKELEEIIFNVCSKLGLPCLKSKTEAERLCSWLVTHNLASACFSSDTDNLVHGCHVLINKTQSTEFRLKHDEVLVYELAEILKGLDMTMEQFKDLCILLSCDYNTNMKGYGIKKCLELIRSYKSFEAIKSSHMFDVECLNYDSCIKLFDSSVEISELYDGSIEGNSLKIESTQIASETCQELLAKYDLLKWQSIISRYYSSFFTN